MIVAQFRNLIGTIDSEGLRLSKVGTTHLEYEKVIIKLWHIL